MTRAATYLDHNASSPLRPEAREAMLAALDLVGNPSSVHAHGRALRNLVETGRHQVAELAGAEPKQVVFTGSATEAITQAILGGARAFSAGAVALSAGEHAAVGKAAEASGLPVWTITLDSHGRIDLDQLTATLQKADDEGVTLLVALHWVNNETGVIQPIERISALVGPTRHTLFIDAVQAFGKLPLEFASSAPDMMAVSGHKIGAPAGIGALLVKSHADMVRLIPGGGQEQGRRGGTESAALIAAFGAAAAATDYHAEMLSGLVRHVETGLQKMVPDLVIFGQGVNRIGNVTNFAVQGLGNATAMMALDLMGLSVSSGSACSSGKVGASHVLAAMGVPRELANCALRVSFGWNSTLADAEAFLAGFETVHSRRKRAGEAA
ncbi:cysteine desulfurase [Devosia subaequoris]|uniref:Cysteine desulfurase n=1 Tax=Devosia subaequoris TaxID=395930 RepID=A0A7W6IJB9_9HYPH|nr:aminotransferase class V-fold PLP-dependent enzyme [Devosia subaequoris]MBB4050663.1 cysteine desulfurase [Devosia subaequoris]MCP1208656.1 aminotransferase class V-fold PLP-dependent enzyme [Devosia subaequoris]